jgi:hypothetical protein
MRLSLRSVRPLPKYLLPPLNVMCSTVIGMCSTRIRIGSTLICMSSTLIRISSTLIRISSTLVRISSTLIRISSTLVRIIRSFPQCLLPHSIKPARTHAGAHATARVRT